MERRVSTSLSFRTWRTGSDTSDRWLARTEGYSSCPYACFRMVEGKNRKNSWTIALGSHTRLRTLPTS